MRTKLLVLALLSTAAACGKSSEPGKDGAKGSGDGTGTAAGAHGAAATPADPGKAEQAKLSAAIECLNRHSGRVFEVRDMYLASVDPRTGAPPADRKPVVSGLFGIDQCAREIAQAGALTPAIAELDGPSADYVAALQALHAAWDALSGYYQKGENLDDQGKRAGELHPKAMAAFDAFAGAHRALDGGVRTLNRKRRVEALAAREKAEGRKLEVIIDSMMLEAETLIAMATSAGAAEAATMQAQIDAYGKLVDEVDAYAGAHADEAKQRGSIANLRNYMKTFLAATKVVSRKLADGGAPTDAEREDAIAQYNALVDNYNNH